MAEYSAEAQTNLMLLTKSRETDQFGYRMVFLLWFLFLFEPARLLAYWLPILEPLKWLPTLLLVAAIFHWIRSPSRKYNYKAFLFFVIVNLFGTVIAYVGGNWGIARTINRQILQFFMLGILAFSYFNDAEKVKKLFLLFFFYILFFSMWGIFSLKVMPIDASLDPGSRVIVAWHPWLDNRDGFGPLMVIGLAFSYYYFQSIDNRKMKWLSVFGIVLCLFGIVLSFGRGVFLSMAAVIIYIWLRSRRKLAGIFVLIAAVGAIVTIESIISPGGLYWETMQTIMEGTSEGTGAERKILWGWAWREFSDYPIFGVGTANFGIALAKVISEEEAVLSTGYTVARLWGKSLHNAPLTILCEYGLVGLVVFSFLIIDFIKTNRRNSSMSLVFLKGANNRKSDDSTRFREATFYHSVTMGLNACFLAFWINAFFYEVIYTSFLWNILAMNRLIYINLLDTEHRNP